MASPPTIQASNSKYSFCFTLSVQEAFASIDVYSDWLEIRGHGVVACRKMGVGVGSQLTGIPSTVEDAAG